MACPPLELLKYYLAHFYNYPIPGGDKIMAPPSQLDAFALV